MKEYLKETVIPRFVEALQAFEKEDIEDALISIYINSELSPGGGKVKELLQQFSIDLDIETVTYIFEALLEKDSIVENGIVFTPEYITSFIVKNSLANVSEWSEKFKIIDPGCGCGIFLITVIGYFLFRPPSAFRP